MQEMIGMQKIREVFRCRFENRLSVREIAASCSIGRQTVANYLCFARLAGINWPEDQKLDDTDLEKKLYSAKVKDKIRKEKESGGEDGADNTGESANNTKQPLDFNYIFEELRRHKNVTKLLLWAEYQSMYKERAYQYDMFCYLCRQWNKKLRISMRQFHKGGEKIFVDYKDGLNIVNPVTGEVTATKLFVAAWGASNYTYAEATMSEKLQDWISSHVRAFEYFQCVSNILVPDNLKSGIIKPDRYEPEINRTYLSLAQHYGTVVIPARIKKPKDKAKVEVAVRIAGMWILAVLRHRIFFSLEDLNKAIRELLEKLNNRPMVLLKKSRKEMFEILDKPNALQLPEKPFEFAEWKKCRPSIDYCIEVSKHYYSVPYQLRRDGRELDVRVTQTIVEVFFNGRRVASHVRSFVEYGFTILKEHMPRGHQEYRESTEWTPSRMIEWAQKTGPNAGLLVKNILESKEYPQMGYRSSLGIIRLTKYFSADRIDKACKRALRFGIYSSKGVHNILKARADQQAEEPEEIGKISPIHANIRGSDYWASKNNPVNLHE